MRCTVCGKRVLASLPQWYSVQMTDGYNFWTETIVDLLCFPCFVWARLVCGQR